MAKKSKRYLALLEKAEAAGELKLDDAVKVLKEFGTTSFDQTIEIHMHLGVDAKQADQIIRGAIGLPHGIGRELRVVVFAKGDLATAAEEAGATEVGSDDLAKKINTMGGLAFSTPGRLLIGDIVQPDFFKKNVITINESYLAEDEMGVLQDFVKKHGTGKINYSDYKGAGSVDVRGKNSPTLSDMSGLSAVERLQKSFGESMIKVIDGDYYLIDQYDFNVFVDYSDTNSSGKGKVYNAEAYDKKFGGLGVADALSSTMGSDRTLFDKLHNLAFIMGSRDYEGTNRDVGRQVRIKIGPVDNRVASN